MAPVVLVALGIVVLLVGAEFVVRGASQLARRLGISPVIIGLTVVSIGTSAPELAIGVQAGLAGTGDLSVGNVAGTNVVNLLLILGLSALILPLPIRPQIVRLDLPTMVITAAVVVLMALDGVLSVFEGVVLLAMAVLYTAILVRLSVRGRGRARAERDEQAEPAAGGEGGRGPLLEVVALLGGMVAVVLGAQWLVDGAVTLARELGVSDALIGLTIVAIGTSAPELATTVVGTLRNDRAVAIGNLIGSSVYNIALILGVTAVVAPGGVRMGQELIAIDLPVMAAVMALCVPVFLSGRRVSRLEGGAFVVGYAGYLAFLLVTRL